MLVPLCLGLQSLCLTYLGLIVEGLQLDSDPLGSAQLLACHPAALIGPNLAAIGSFQFFSCWFL